MSKSISFSALLAFLGGTLLASVQAQTINYTPYSFTTVAGSLNGNGGLVNGTGSVAQFASPSAVAVDSSGTIYIADTSNYAVRKATAAGVVTTLAGTGAAGHVDGPGASAQFGPLKGIVVDGAGNVYVSDWGNASGSAATIRKITASGTVSTLVSSGLSLPQGLALDSSGTLYVADAGNAVIRKVSSGGALTVFAGSLGNSGSTDGVPGTGQFGFPVGIAFDINGNLFVADKVLDDIRKVTSNGSISTYSGSIAQPAETDGPISSAQFSAPTGMAADAQNNLYIIDDGRLVREINAAGVVSTLGGTLTTGSNDGAGMNALFYGATGLAATPSGMIYIADTNNNTIRTGVSIAGLPPVIQYQPASETVNNGYGGSPLMVTVSGANVIYQWYLNGVAIPGATSASYPVNSVSANQGGTYTVVATNPNGSVTSNPVTLTVQTLGQIVNLSTLDGAGSGQNALTAGFTLSGSSSTSKKLLVRGVGPTLSAFATPNPLAAPQLSLFASGSTTALAFNASWGNDPALIAAFNSTGAFQLPANSADSALLQMLAGGGYSAQITGANGTSGNALVEIYDDDLTNTTSQLINISSRANITPTAPLTVGFVLSGTSYITLVIRAIGPALSGFGVTGTLNQTTLTIFDGTSNVLYTNTGWGSSATLSTAFNSVAAFPLTPNSGDSALLVTLPPGKYSAQASSASGLSGIGLVELFLLK